jgi:hypothetical protein
MSRLQSIQVNWVIRFDNSHPLTEGEGQRRRAYQANLQFTIAPHHATQSLALAYALAFAFAACNSRMLVRKSISWHNIGPSVYSMYCSGGGMLVGRAIVTGHPFLVARVTITTINFIPLFTPPPTLQKFSVGKSLSCSRDDQISIS